nr:RING zinc finger protein, putative [Oryza sativa Japonica Group]
MEANREREKKILNDTKYSLPSPLPGDDSTNDDACSEVSDMELCCICFDQACTIEVSAVTAVASAESVAAGVGAAATID